MPLDVRLELASPGHFIPTRMTPEYLRPFSRFLALVQMTLVMHNYRIAAHESEQEDNVSSVRMKTGVIPAGIDARPKRFRSEQAVNQIGLTHDFRIIQKSRDVGPAVSR